MAERRSVIRKTADENEAYVCGVGTTMVLHNHSRQTPWTLKACRNTGNDFEWHANHVEIARENVMEVDRAITAVDTDSIASTAQRRAPGDLVVLPAWLSPVTLQDVVRRRMQESRRGRMSAGSNMKSGNSWISNQKHHPGFRGLSRAIPAQHSHAFLQ
jgi:hypothetical protein